MTTAGDTRGIITASTEAMLNTRLRAELRKWFRLFRAANFFDLTMTALLPKDTSHEQTWRIDLLPWNPNRPESFAGLHNAGRPQSCRPGLRRRARHHACRLCDRCGFAQPAPGRHRG